MADATSLFSALRKRLGSKVALENTRNGNGVATHVATAFDSAARRTGLLKHESMAEGAALVIAPTNAVHTFFMRFPLDVAFITREGRITSIRHGLHPWRIAVGWRAYAVIELPSGTLKRSDTVPGDTLRVISALE